jgi:acid phosphatase (class A)
MDADLKFPWAAGDFSCALGAPVTEEDTPRLYVMLKRMMTDAGAATGAAKDKYQHARPFMLEGQPTCTPQDEKALRENGSYPSGHTSIGWAWALVLAETSPVQSNAILARGRAFGESRLVCNVHWDSDVMEGLFIGAATVARLHAEPAFLADLEAAKSELKAARAKNLPPQRDCKFEADALSQTPVQSP